MSFMVEAAAERLGIPLDVLTAEQAPSVLLDAVRHDMPEAVKFLRQTVAESRRSGERIMLDIGFGKPLFPHLMRIYASPARGLLEQELGVPLTFFNCHIFGVGGRPLTLEEQALIQIQCQNGRIASRDC